MSHPQRIVSLVPSITDSLIGLGAAQRLAGVTDFCPAPLDGSRLERVGGPKSLEISRILELKPDLVLANREENDRSQIEWIIQAGLRVEVEFPLTPRQALESLERLAAWIGCPGHPKLGELRRGLELAEDRAGQRRPFRYFCPIWGGQGKQPDWWMTFNQGTYPHALLALFGGVNGFAERERRYPLAADLGLAQAEDPAGRDTRYPAVGLSELVASKPDVILLPDEPMNFHAPGPRERLVAALQNQIGRIPALVEIQGSLLFWPGLRLLEALEKLPSLLIIG